MSDNSSACESLPTLTGMLSSCIHNRIVSIPSGRKGLWGLSPLRLGRTSGHQARFSQQVTKCVKESERLDTGAVEPVAGVGKDQMPDLECFGTGMEVECLIDSPGGDVEEVSVVSDAAEEDVWTKGASLALLISPFFFWGTSMALMKVPQVTCRI